MNPGDIVRLKCGGPKMVIAEMATYQSKERPWWLCHWQDADGHHAAANYYECELEPVSEGAAAAVVMQNQAAEQSQVQSLASARMQHLSALGFSREVAERESGFTEAKERAALEAHIEVIEAKNEKLELERDEWKAKAEQAKSDAEYERVRADNNHQGWCRTQKDFDECSKQLAARIADSSTAMKAWRLLESISKCGWIRDGRFCDDCGKSLIDFIRDNPPPKEG